MRPLVALALVLAVVPIAAAAPLSLGLGAPLAVPLPPPARSGLVIEIEPGPFRVTPAAAPAVVPGRVTFTDVALDPLRLGLVQTTIDLAAIVDGAGRAVVEPAEVRVRSDGRPADVTLVAHLDLEAPAWEQVLVTVTGTSRDPEPLRHEATAETVLIPTHVCLVEVDGTLEAPGDRPEKGPWTILGRVYVRNSGNGPLAVTFETEDVAQVGDVDFRPWRAKLPAGEEDSRGYSVTLDDAREWGDFSWRVLASAVAAETPPDGGSLPECAAEDTVRVGDEREGWTYPTPSLGAMGAIAAAGAALAIARSRRRD